MLGSQLSTPMAHGPVSVKLSFKDIPILILQFFSMLAYTVYINSMWALTRARNKITFNKVSVHSDEERGCVIELQSRPFNKTQQNKILKYYRDAINEADHALEMCKLKDSTMEHQLAIYECDITQLNKLIDSLNEERSFLHKKVEIHESTICKLRRELENFYENYPGSGYLNYSYLLYTNNFVSFFVTFLISDWVSFVLTPIFMYIEQYVYDYLWVVVFLMFTLGLNNSNYFPYIFAIWSSCFLARHDIPNVNLSILGAILNTVTPSFWTAILCILGVFGEQAFLDYYSTKIFFFQALFGLGEYRLYRRLGATYDSRKWALLMHIFCVFVPQDYRIFVHLIFNIIATYNNNLLWERLDYEFFVVKNLFNHHCINGLNNGTLHNVVNISYTGYSIFESLTFMIDNLISNTISYIFGLYGKYYFYSRFKHKCKRKLYKVRNYFFSFRAHDTTMRSHSSFHPILDQIDSKELRLLCFEVLCLAHELKVNTIDSQYPIIFSKFGMKVGMLYPKYTTKIVDNITSFVDNLTKVELQSISKLRKIIRTYNVFKGSKINETIQMILAYCVMSPLLLSRGLNLDKKSFEHLFHVKYTKYIKEEGEVDFFVSMLSNILDIFESGIQYKNDEISFSEFVHSGDSYAKWIDLHSDILVNQNVMNDEPDNTKAQLKLLSDIEKFLYQAFDIRKAAKERGDSRISIVNKMIIQVKDVKRRVDAYVSSATDRVTPFSLLVTGPPQCGKTTALKIMQRAYLDAENLDGEQLSTILFTFNSKDDYFTNYTNSTKIVVCDDIAAVRPQSGKQDNSLDPVLNLVSSLPYYPAMAALDDKGTVVTRPDLVIATSNTEDLNARKWFVNGAAFLRRFPWVVYPEVDERFRDANIRGATINRFSIDKFRSFKLQNPGEEVDPILFTIKRVVLKHQDINTVDRQIIETKLTERQFYLWCLNHYVEHMDEQKAYKAKNDSFLTQERCENCHLVKKFCDCVEIDEEIDIKDAKSSGNDGDLSSVGSINPISSLCESEDEVYDDLTIAYMNTRDVIDDHIRALYIVLKEHKEFYPNHVYIENSFDFIKPKHSTSLLNFSNYTEFLENVEIVGLDTKTDYRCIRAYEMQSLQDEYNKIINLGNEILEEMHDKYNVLHIVATLTFVAGAYYAYKMYTKPVDYKEVLSDHKKTNDQTWVASASAYTPYVFPEKTSQFSQLKDIVESNMFIVDSGEGNARTHILGITGNFFLSNAHTFEDLKDDEILEVSVKSCQTKNFKLKNGYSGTITKDNVYITDSDLAILYIPDMPPCRDITKHFCTSTDNLYHMDGFNHNIGNGKFLHNDIMPVEHNMTSMSVLTFNKTGRNGDCGTPYLVKNKKSVVVGIHCAKLSRGRSAIIPITQKCLKEELDNSMKHFKLENYFSQGVLPISSHGIFDGMKQTHYKSEVRNLTGYGLICGSIKNYPLHNTKSTVVETDLKPIVDKIFDEHNLPRQEYTGGITEGVLVNGEWQNPYVNSIQKCTNPKKDMTISDYNEILTEFKRKMKTLKKMKIKPLNDYTMVNGIPGDPVLNRVKTDTSMGFPYNQKKINFILPDPTPNDVDGYKFIPEIYEEIKEIESCYKKNVRYSPIFNACLKDEPIPLRKKYKTRVFCSAPVAFNLLIRKYYLPLVKFIKANVDVFGSMVGINCHSTAWTEMVKRMDNLILLFDGDFSSFDKACGPLSLLLSWQMYIEVAKFCGYKAYHTKMMSGIAVDCVYCYINIRGTIIRVNATNPSGHAMTTYVNNKLNLTYSLYTFKHLYSINLFWYIVKFYYGDDNLFNVPYLYKEFNHTNMQRILKQIGVTYTMADKEAESVPFKPLSQVSLLKRRFILDKNNRAWAPIEIMSIYKSLAYRVKLAEGVTEFQRNTDTLKAAFVESIPHSFETALFPVIKEIEKRYCSINDIPVPERTFKSTLEQHF